MNEPRARAHPVMNGWEGQFRKLDRAGWHPVEVNGVAQLYDTPEQALIAAYEAMNAYLFGRGILRDGEKASAEKSRAEELFNKVWPGKGRKPVEVVRR
ncbi:MAG: hypothetical protein K5872_22170 [Rhizobiaceae bacterium]|nr:hypothetical protein [Rhizobiaceae bacterium]MCV0408927.1 hypothetical protein [Rhizobiaceae bacterium]